MDSPFPKILPPLLMALLLALSPLQAAPKNDSVAPPSPSSGEVVGSPRVVRGGVCEVIVRGIVMPRDSAEFKVHKRPKHGTLEGPVLKGSETAVYTYRHNGKKGADSDRIDFRIKTGPNNTWGPVTAILAIEEPPSRVELMDSQLDFGPVPIGQPRSTFLRVRNGGGGILRGSLETGAPWSIDGPAEFELAEGEARDIRVVFSPDGPGERQGRLDVVAGRDRQPVTLRGEGVYRFAAPERVFFEKNGTENILEIPLTNLTDRELPLSIDLPKPLLGESSLALPANSAAVLRLELEKRHYTEKAVEISLADGPAVKTLRVILPAPPALLEWTSANGTVDLGEIPAGGVPRPGLQIHNRGATHATVSLLPKEGGLELAENQPRTFELPPGKSAEVSTVWRLPKDRGAVESSIVASHGGLDHPLRLAATIVVPPPPGESTPRPAANPAPSPTPLDLLTEAERRELERRRPRDVRYRLVAHGSSATAIVKWNYSGPEPALFWLEFKSTRRPSTNLASAFEDRLKIPVPEELPKPEAGGEWVRAASAEYPVQRIGNGTWQGAVEGLKPGYHQVRLVSRVPANGKRLDYQSFAVHVGTLPASPYGTWIAAALGILCLLYLLRKKLRPPCSGGL